jgi:hypothetical protein
MTSDGKGFPRCLPSRAATAACTHFCMMTNTLCHVLVRDGAAAPPSGTRSAASTASTSSGRVPSIAAMRHAQYPRESSESESAANRIRPTVASTQDASHTHATQPMTQLLGERSRSGSCGSMAARDSRQCARSASDGSARNSSARRLR